MRRAASNTGLAIHEGFYNQMVDAAQIAYVKAAGIYWGLYDAHAMLSLRTDVVQTHIAEAIGCDSWRPQCDLRSGNGCEA